MIESDLSSSKVKADEVFKHQSTWLSDDMKSPSTYKTTSHNVTPGGPHIHTGMYVPLYHEIEEPVSELAWVWYAVISCQVYIWTNVDEGTDRTAMPVRTSTIINGINVRECINTKTTLIFSLLMKPHS